MNLAYDIFDDPSISAAISKKEQKSYYDYLLAQAKNIPDKWMPKERSHESESLYHLYFDSKPPKLKLYIKAFAYELMFYYQLRPGTLSGYLTSIDKLFEIAENPNELDIDTDFKNLFEKHIENMYEKVKNNVLEAKSVNTESSIGTAKSYSANVLRFIHFLGGYTEKNNWSSSYDISKKLPKKLAKYFTLPELQVYRNELRSVYQARKTRAIPYSMLHDIMEFVYALPPSCIKTVIIIAAHTGLRISEIRGLEINCLEKVSKTEISSVENYLEEIGRTAGIRADFGESYWLSGYLVFKKKGEVPAKGVPILVGKEVKQAIDELIKLASKDREASGSNMLLINRSDRYGYTVRSYTSLLKDRSRLVEQGMPFITFHQFRATFATILADLKVPIGMIQKYLNHISSDVTSGYIASERERDIQLLNAILSGRVTNAYNNESYGQFEKELKSVVSTSEFAGLSFGSQATFFRRLLKEHDIKINFADHGHCVLPADEICPHGYENVAPCHTSGCKKFKPDPNEKPFFVGLLATRKEQRETIEQFAIEHGGIDVNLERFDSDMESISNILDLINKAS